MKYLVLTVSGSKFVCRFGAFFCLEARFTSVISKIRYPLVIADNKARGFIFSRHSTGFVPGSVLEQCVASPSLRSFDSTPLKVERRSPGTFLAQAYGRYLIGYFGWIAFPNLWKISMNTIILKLGKVHVFFHQPMSPNYSKKCIKIGRMSDDKDK